jgi:hypothetical protein
VRGLLLVQEWLHRVWLTLPGSVGRSALPPLQPWNDRDTARAEDAAAFAGNVNLAVAGPADPPVAARGSGLR